MLLTTEQRDDASEDVFPDLDIEIMQFHMVYDEAYKSMWESLLPLALTYSEMLDESHVKAKVVAESWARKHGFPLRADSNGV